MGNIKVDINPKALDQSLFVNLTKKTQTNQKNIMKSFRYYLEKYTNPINVVAYSVSLYICHVVLMDWIRFVSSWLSTTYGPGPCRQR
jgi:hypothetical protein